MTNQYIGVNVLLTREQNEKVRQLSFKIRVSKSQFVRDAVLEKIKLMENSINSSPNVEPLKEL